MANNEAIPKMRVGQAIQRRTLLSIHDERIDLPDPHTLVHLQFRRYASCPVCNLHLRSIAARHNELVAAGITEIAVFHSSRKAMLRHQKSLPFTTVADPHKALYAEFGVENSPRAVGDPRAWGAMVRGIARFGPSAPSRGESPFGLPADFIIAPSGVILACKYGVHADDHWSVDELFGCVTRSRHTPSATPGRS